MKAVLIFASLCAVPAHAQVEPVATPNDPGVQDLNYASIQPMHLIVSRGGDLTLTLASGEVAQSISTNSPNNWQVGIGSPPNTIVVHAGQSASDANLSVLTDKRLYNFLLTPAAPTRAPYLIRMTYFDTPPPGAANASSAAKMVRPARYRLTGNRELRPVAMTDDGSKTYIEWSPDQAIPAVFALDRLKREEMVNGYMRNDVFTIDRVYDRLLFRIDRAQAMATRQAVRKGK